MTYHEDGEFWKCYHTHLEWVRFMENPMTCIDAPLPFLLLCCILLFCPTVPHSGEEEVIPTWPLWKYSSLFCSMRISYYCTFCKFTFPTACYAPPVLFTHLEVDWTSLEEEMQAVPARHSTTNFLQTFILYLRHI